MFQATRAGAFVFWHRPGCHQPHADACWIRANSRYGVGYVRALLPL